MLENRIHTTVVDLRDGIGLLNQGLVKMLGIQAQHGALLKEILAACTAEPEEETPLVKLIRQLVAAIEAQTATLARIEAKVTQAR
jgi:hypothetical protein